MPDNRLNVERGRGQTVVKRVIETIKEVTPSRTYSSAFSVSVLTILGLLLAIIGGGAVQPLVLGFISGGALIIAIRSLGSGHPGVLIVGGAVAPIGAGTLLAAVGLGIQVAGLQLGVVTALTGVVVGLGFIELFVGGLTHTTLRTAMGLYTLALIGLGITAALALIATGNLLSTFVVRIVGFVTDASAALMTAGTSAAAAPTTVLLGAGCLLLARFLGITGVPYIFTENTRNRLDSARETGRRVLRRVAVSVVILGGTTVGLLTTGVTTQLSGAAAVLLRTLAALIGSTALRTVAIVVLTLGVVLISGRWLYLTIHRLTLSSLASAVLPAVGIGVGAAGLTLIIATSGIALPINRIPILAGVVGSTDIPGGPPSVLVLSAVVIADALLAIVWLAALRLPAWGPAVGVLGLGLTGVPVIVALSGGNPLVTLASTALIVLVVDIGRTGISIGTEIGRRDAIQTELLRGGVGALVGLFTVGLLFGILGADPFNPPVESALTSAVGLGALVFVLYTFGWRLSA